MNLKNVLGNLSKSRSALLYLIEEAGDIVVVDDLQLTVGGIPLYAILADSNRLCYVDEDGEELFPTEAEETQILDEVIPVC